MSEQPVRIVAEERWAFVARAGAPGRAARWNDRHRRLQVGVADGRRAIGAFSSGGRVVKLWPVRRRG